MEYILVMTEFECDSNLIPNLNDLAFCKVLAALLSGGVNLNEEGTLTLLLSTSEPVYPNLYPCSNP